MRARGGLPSSLGRGMTPSPNSEVVEYAGAPPVCCLYGLQGMEHLWSRAVATGGNRWQTRRRRERPKQAKTVAMGCDQLPIGAHGKEGVDGSSPSEGSANCLQICHLCRPDRRQDWPDGHIRTHFLKEGVRRQALSPIAKARVPSDRQGDPAPSAEQRCRKWR